MGERRYWFALSGLALVTLCSLLVAVRAQVQVQRLESVPASISARTDESIRQIDQATRNATETVERGVRADLQKIASSVSAEQVQALETKLRALSGEVAQREAEIRRLSDRQAGLVNGLPEQIDLDSLNDFYSQKWPKEALSFTTIETFNTALGPIPFKAGDFTFAYIPSSKELAWLKIGKNSSTENLELIRTWLDESEKAKTTLGYVRQYRITKPSDYGEYTETLCRKGDAYFKTYLQSQRVQGTYGRHSMQYTYYVEVGSIVRKERYELEQYNQKLGS